MTVEVADLRHYCGAPTGDNDFLENVLAEAAAIMTEYVQETPIPESAWDGCLLQVSSELYHRRNAPSGITQFASMDGTGMRMSLDVMKSVYAILDRWVVRGV
jgi:hypothetical protein